MQILAINDFHGHLEPPPPGSLSEVATAQGFITAGGVAYLAADIEALRAEAPHTVVVSAGDMLGGSPLTSALLHDEPTVEAMDLLGLDIAVVGNHEFDDGVDELLRMKDGGCHPVDGCVAYEPGQQLHDILEEQFTVPTAPQVLEVSAGFTYAFSLSAAAGNKVDPASMMLDGVPIGLADEVWVAINDFVASGGGGFTGFANGIDVLGGPVDVEALQAYFAANSPVAPVTQERVTALP